MLKIGPLFLYFFIWIILTSPEALNLDVCMSFPPGNHGSHQDLMRSHVQMDPLDPMLTPVLFLTTNLLSTLLQPSIFVISIMPMLNIASGIRMTPLGKYMLMYDSIILQRALDMQR